MIGLQLNKKVLNQLQKEDQKFQQEQFDKLNKFEKDQFDQQVGACVCG
jgi:hypothetical protein